MKKKLLLTKREEKERESLINLALLASLTKKTLNEQKRERERKVTPPTFKRFFSLLLIE